MAPFLGSQGGGVVGHLKTGVLHGSADAAQAHGVAHGSIQLQRLQSTSLRPGTKTHCWLAGRPPQWKASTVSCTTPMPSQACAAWQHAGCMSTSPRKEGGPPLRMPEAINIRQRLRKKTRRPGLAHGAELTRRWEQKSSIQNQRA